MPEVHPFLILAIGIAVVLGGILVLRINAFISLITAAIVISLLAPGEWATKIERVAAAFGSTAASIGIVIALAAVIGQAMMDSGAADRIVRAFLRLLGEKRTNVALSGSGFVLSIPVFFDTAFYLLVPLARSAFKRTGKGYLKLLMAIVAGGALTHNLVPPTPGPLFIANRFGVDLGVMIGMGVAVGVPAMIVGLAYGHWLNKRMPVEMRPLGDDDAAAGPPSDTSREPNLLVALSPIVLPILLITTNSIVKVLAQRAIPDAPLTDPDLTEAILKSADEGAGVAQLFRVTNVLGNPNLALLLSAAIAVTTLWLYQRPGRKLLSSKIESALLSGGLIILITAAGGAFGGMLKAANLGDAIAGQFGDTATSGVMLLLFAFGITSLIKFAQGSSTAAAIVASGMIAAMIDPADLPYNPVYLALSIGSGALVGSWMNDSGFWIYSKMGGLTEAETLKSWTPLLALLGITSGAMTILLAIALPMK